MWGEPEVRIPCISDFSADSTRDSFGFTSLPLDACIRMSNARLAPIRLYSIQLVVVEEASQSSSLVHLLTVSTFSVYFLLTSHSLYHSFLTYTITLIM
jgi:hypothetical protein